MPLLEVRNLSVDFKVDGRWLPAVSDVSFAVGRGEIVALVGESGCGKSVTCLSLARLVPEPAGRYAAGSVLLEFGGRTLDTLRLPPRELRAVRGAGIAYIFQEPFVSLNPVFKVGDQIAEAVALHRPDVADVDAEVVEALRRVGIPDPARRAGQYPHEMSGGMAQRVMAAIALASRPELLVADEPTTALDVTVQAQILALLREIRDKTGTAIVIVTHNLGVVAELADRVLVMYAGQAVEEAPTAALLDAPAHPYTRALLAVIPKMGGRGGKLPTIPGSVPAAGDYPPGCRFAGRCALAASLPAEKRERCLSEPPAMRGLAPGRRCRCHHARLDA